MENKKNFNITLILDIILIILVLAIGFYVYSELENFKALGSDVCNLCMQKTGTQCIKFTP